MEKFSFEYSNRLDNGERKIDIAVHVPKIIVIGIVVLGVVSMIEGIVKYVKIADGIRTFKKS